MDSKTPKRQSTATLTSRRQADISALLSFQQNFCSISKGDQNQEFEIVNIEIKPALDLVLTDPVLFEVRLSSAYPTQPPTVYCRSNTQNYSDINEIEPDGQVKISLLQEHIDCGWSRLYNLIILFYGLRLLFQTRTERWEYCRPPGQDLNCIGRKSPNQKNQNQRSNIARVPLTLESSRFALNVVHSSQQGVRRSMEDAFSIETNLSVTIQGTQHKNVGLVCLMDGHGGNLCADYCSEKLPGLFCGRLASGLGWKHSLYQAILDIDLDLHQEFTSAERVGCTCLCVAFDGWRRCYIANVGDCRAVLCRSKEAVVLTCDARADRPDEIARISRAGGFVAHGRVNGKLAVSRALGDFTYKKTSSGNGKLMGAIAQDSIVISEPEISDFEVTEEDEFLIVACDGLWDVMTSETAVGFVLEGLKAGQAIQQIADSLVHTAIHDLDSTDNVSAIIIQFYAHTKDDESSLETSLGSLLDSPILSGLLSPQNKEHAYFNGEERQKELRDMVESFSIDNVQKNKSIEDLNDDELFDYLLNEKNFK